MKQVLGIRDEKTRMKVTLPLAVAPITQDDDMRWNPNYPMQQRSFSKRMMMALFPTLKGAARPITTPITTYHHIKHAPATSHKNQVNSLLYILHSFKLSNRRKNHPRHSAMRLALALALFELRQPCARPSSQSAARPANAARLPHAQ